MKKFKIITSIVLCITLLAGSISSFTIAPITNAYAMSKEQTTNFFDESKYLDQLLGKEDSDKGSSDPKVVYNHVSKFIKNNYSSLTKKKLLNEFDYLKDSANAIIREKLNDSSGIGKFVRRVEYYINEIKLYWDKNIYNANLKQLINNIKVATDESKRLFGAFRKELKGKKPLDVVGYLLDEKTHGKIAHHILHIDGIIFKNVNVKTIIPKDFTNKKINQFTEKVKYVADIGVSYNKMKRKDRNQVKHNIVNYINRPKNQLINRINNFLLKAEHKVLNTYKFITTSIKKKH